MSNTTEITNQVSSINWNDFFAAMNQSGFSGIPLQVSTTTAVVSSQFYINVGLALLGSIFILMFVWGSVKPMASVFIARRSLNKIKNITGRSILFIKHTRSGLFNSSMIDQDTLIKISEAFEKFDGKPFDLILHTPGGEIFSSMYISRLLKEYPGEVRVIVPYFAMSGGTLLALSGDSIHLAKTACLGPVDPQLGNLFKFGSAKSWDKIMKFKGKKADDQSISFAFMGMQYTKSISNHINSLLVGKIAPNQRKKFVDFLTSGDVEHAYPLTVSKLREFGLPVHSLDDKITSYLNKIISKSLYEGVYHFK